MVKAMKRRDVAVKDSPQKKKRGKDFKIKIASLFIMVLLFFGFTIAAYWGFSPDNTKQEDPIDNRPEYEFGICTLDGVEEASVVGVTDYLAIFGQLNVPQDLERRLGGDLYLLDNGLTHLILTDADEGEINAQVSGSFIVYKVADCGSFDCLFEGDVNGTAMFDVYSVDKGSKFLKTSRIGFLNG